MLMHSNISGTCVAGFRYLSFRTPQLNLCPNPASLKAPLPYLYTVPVLVISTGNYQYVHNIKIDRDLAMGATRWPVVSDTRERMIWVRMEELSIGCCSNRA
jgi:hypothetical protein